jgi:alcohol dehydrogenase class IV
LNTEAVLAPFEFATAGRIVFGRGVLARVGALTREFGSRALIVTGRNVERSEQLRELLSRAGIYVQPYAIANEPTIDDAQQGATVARAAQCDVVIGFGGGSAIDAAKAMAALLTNTAPVTDYLEVIGRGLPLETAPAPCIAIPTTAGTGAEVTRNAVLASPHHRAKVSLRSQLMLPRVALIDPELTYTLPPALTAATGLDALTQLIEPYVSLRANAVTDPLCVDGLRRVSRALRLAFGNGRDVAAREDMAVASLFGGLALANAGLGAVHGFAGPIGGAFSKAAHGAICAALLPAATIVNISGLRRCETNQPAITRYGEIAQILTGRSTATADDLAPWLQQFTAALGTRRLSSYGVTMADIPPLVAAAMKSSSMKTNPVVLSSEELSEILIRAL